MNSTIKRQRDWAAIGLTACALAVGGLITTHLSRLVGGTPAAADLVSSNQEFTMLTAEAGSGEDVVVALDQRGEALLLYRCVNQRSIEFKGRFDMRELFFAAKHSGK